MKGLLYLEDGSIFQGEGFGFPKTSVGELVFNTSMTGYQEILTDPSYAGQIINFTYPLIGNYGIAESENESKKIHAFGAIAKHICFHPSNYKSVDTIDQWLFHQKVPGLFEMDTRAITRKIRKFGSMKCVLSNEGISIAQAKKLCDQTTLTQDYMKTAGTKDMVHIRGNGPKVCILDLGIKSSILEELKKRECDLYLFPYKTTAEQLMSVKPDGLFLSNGPGNPQEADEAIREIQKLLSVLPIFGICMGHQLLAHAVGGSTYKMKYGHRGANHGVFDKDTGCSSITSQNHGFAVDPESILLTGMEISHINLNDRTMEGMRHRSLPIFSVQFHPEASPGPNDSSYLFDRFVTLMKGDKLYA